MGIMSRFLGTGSFDADKDIPDLSGQVAVVTGGNTGIGYTTTIALAAKNARVFLLARSEPRAQAAIEKIKALHPSAQVEWIQFDLCDLKSCKAAAEEIGKRTERVDILVNNAGIMATPYRLTDGIENQFYNHLGHFCLTKYIAPVLKATAEAGHPVRITTTTSVGHKLFGTNEFTFENIDVINKDFGSPWTRYAQSKLANILFSSHLAKHLSLFDLPESTPSRIFSNAAHPGNVDTELLRGPKEDSLLMRVIAGTGIIKLFSLSPKEGAATQLWTVTNDRVVNENITGRYFTPIAQLDTPSALALDEQRAGALWALSEKLIAERV